MPKNTGFRCGLRKFKGKAEFKRELNRSMTEAIQSAKLKVINYIRSPGGNRGFLFPKDTSFLIQQGMLQTSLESFGGTNFEFVFGFDKVPYAIYLETVEGNKHQFFHSSKIPRVEQILNDTINQTLKTHGFSISVQVQIT